MTAPQAIILCVRPYIFPCRVLQVGDLAEVPLCALESKTRLALMCLAAGCDVCPAAVFIPWDADALAGSLAHAVCAASPWVLKRDAMSNGEGVFFVSDVDHAMDIISSQRHVGVECVCLHREAKQPDTDPCASSRHAGRGPT